MDLQKTSGKGQGRKKEKEKGKGWVKLAASKSLGLDAPYRSMLCPREKLGLGLLLLRHPTAWLFCPVTVSNLAFQLLGFAVMPISAHECFQM